MRRVRSLQLPGAVVAAAVASCLPLLSSLPRNLPAAVDADVRRMGSSLRADGGGCSLSVSVNSAASQRQKKAAGRLHHMVQTDTLPMFVSAQCATVEHAHC